MRTLTTTPAQVLPGLPLGGLALLTGPDLSSPPPLHVWTLHSLSPASLDSHPRWERHVVVHQCIPRPGAGLHAALSDTFRLCFLSSNNPSSSPAPLAHLGSGHRTFAPTVQLLAAGGALEGVWERVEPSRFPFGE